MRSQMNSKAVASAPEIKYNAPTPFRKSLNKTRESMPPLEKISARKLSSEDALPVSLFSAAFSPRKMPNGFVMALQNDDGAMRQMKTHGEWPPMSRVARPVSISTMRQK